MKNSTLLCIATLLLIIISQKIIAQEYYTISGYITNAESGESLISANVFDGKTKSGTVSNLYGFYSVTLPKDSVYLSISYIGFEAQSLALYLDKDIDLNISLSNANTFDVVEITAASSTDSNIEESTQMSTVVVPIQQIKKMPALLGEVDVLKSLQLLPGVQSGGEGQSGLYVRGGSPDQNLILLDGVPVYNVNHLFGFFSVFNADAIKDVKLTKGGFPARYGGRLSSVLEINMKEGNNQKISGAGSIGLISSKLSLEGPIIKNKASFIVTGRRTYIDLIARPFVKRSFEREGLKGNTGYYFYDLNAKVNYKISDNDRLYLSAYSGDDRFYANTETNDSDTDIEKLETNLGWGNFTSAFRWNHKWSNKLFSNLTATYSKYKFSTLVGSGYEEFEQGELVNKDFYKADYSSGINDIALKYDFDFIPKPNHYVKFGAQAIRHSFNPGIFNLKIESIYEGETEFELDTLLGQSTVKALEYNAFIEDDFKISESTKINFGVHASGFSLDNTDYFSVQPRISIRQLLANKMALKASFSTMRQYVQFLTNEGLGLPTDLWLPTTERVLPQDSWQAAAGIAKNLGSGYELSVEAYYKWMKNIISYKEGASFFSLNPWEDLVTQGDGRSYGLEVFLQKKKGKFTGWLGYTLSKSERRFEDKNLGDWYPFKYDRTHDVSVVGVYELSDKINLSATWVYGTGNAVTLANSSASFTTNGGDFFSWYDYFNERNNFRYNAYHRLDVNVDFIKNRGNFKRVWSIGVYNAYSRNNPFYLNPENENVVNSEGVEERKTVLKQYSLFPIIPSISYRFEF